MSDVSTTTTAIQSSKPTHMHWEFAFVYDFVSVFRKYTDHGIHPFPDFQPEDLEQALNMEASDLLNELLSSFLSNILNRKKRLDSKHVVKELSRLINAKLQTFEIKVDHNPLSEVSSFNNLSAPVKLNILRWMVEWQLQESTSIHSVLDTASKSNQVVLRTQPIGSDSEKRTYWHSGDTPWLWREQKATLKKANEQWEIVCRDLEELEKFTQTLSQGKRPERELYQHLTEQVIPMIEDAQRKRERKARAMERQLAAEQLITTRRLRSRQDRKPVKYTFDDDDVDEEDEDEYKAEGDGIQSPDHEPDEFEKKEPHRVQPLRTSRRLNPDRSSASISPPPSSSPISVGEVVGGEENGIQNGHTVKEIDGIGIN